MTRPRPPTPLRKTGLNGPAVLAEGLHDLDACVLVRLDTRTAGEKPSTINPKP